MNVPVTTAKAATPKKGQLVDTPGLAGSAGDDWMPVSLTEEPCFGTGWTDGETDCSTTRSIPAAAMHTMAFLRESWDTLSTSDCLLFIL